MDRYKKYLGVVLLIVLIILSIFGTYKVIYPRIEERKTLENTVIEKQNEHDKLQRDLEIVVKRIEQIKNSIATSQKKVYFPSESDLGSETIFFTLYSDIIDMLKTNSVKIKSVNYNYNPETDPFVKFGKDTYFVCDVNFELVSNYVNLGRFIEDLYKYPYYLKINSIEIQPYNKDKKILITKLSIRIYSHTSPDTSNKID